MLKIPASGGQWQKAARQECQGHFKGKILEKRCQRNSKKRRGSRSKLHASIHFQIRRINGRQISRIKSLMCDCSLFCTGIEEREGKELDFWSFDYWPAVVKIDTKSKVEFVVSSITMVYLLPSWASRKHPRKRKTYVKGKSRMASLRLAKETMGFDDTTLKTPVIPTSFWSGLFTKIWQQSSKLSSH